MEWSGMDVILLRVKMFLSYFTALVAGKNVTFTSGNKKIVESFSKLMIILLTCTYVIECSFALSM